MSAHRKRRLAARTTPVAAALLTLAVTLTVAGCGNTDSWVDATPAADRGLEVVQVLGERLLGGRGERVHDAGAA